MIKIDLYGRLTLEQVSILFFGDVDVAKCVKGEVTPREWGWRKTGFNIKEHGGFLVFLMLNGLLEEKSEKFAWEFFEKYVGRLGFKRPKMCLSRRILESGVSCGIMYATYSHISNKQLYIIREMITQYPIFYEVFYDKALEKQRHMIKCGHFSYLTEIYKKLYFKYKQNHTNRWGRVIDINAKPEDMARVIRGEASIYDVALSFTDSVIIGAVLRVLAVSRPTRKTIESVESFLVDYCENWIEQPEKIDYCKSTLQSLIVSLRST